MKDQERIQRYVNDFRRHFSTYLRKGVGMSTLTHPSDLPGAIIEIRIGESVTNEDRFLEPTTSVNEALTSIQQKAFGGNLQGFRFGGTSIVMESDKIVLIKGDDSEDNWSDKSASKDVSQIVNSTDRGPHENR